MADVNYTDYFDNATLLEQLDEEMARKLAPVTTYMVVVMVTGIVGNSLVCYVYGVKMKKSTAYSFILWLASLDLTTCLIGLPMETYDLVHRYTFVSPVFCKIFRFTVYFTILTAAATLLFIAADRYCKICRPFKVSPIRRCRVVVVLSIIASARLSWPALVIYGNNRISTPYPDLYGMDCNLSDSYIGTPVAKIYLGTLGFCFMLSVMLLILLYSLIVFKLYKRSQTVIGEPVKFSSPQNCATNISPHDKHAGDVDLSREIRFISQTGGNRSFKLGRTGLIFMCITLVLVLSFLPVLALLVVRTVKTKWESTFSDTEYVLYCFGVRTYFINNSTNVFIYGCINPVFRRECVQTWRKVKLAIITKCQRKQKNKSIGKRLSDSSRAEPVTEDGLQGILNIGWVIGAPSSLVK